MEKKISIIILNYNTVKHVERLISELEHYLVCGCDVEIIIVDNSENTLEWQKIEQISNEKYLIKKYKSAKNIGYSAGNNIGLMHAHESGSTHYLILNPDVKIVEEIDLNFFIETLDNEIDIGVLGPIVENPLTKREQGPFDRPELFIEIIHEIRTNFKIFRQRKNTQMAKDKLSGAKHVYAIVGCFLFGELHILKNVNYLDDRSFLTNEEYILSEKLAKLGKKPKQLREFKVQHLHAVKKNRLGKEFFLLKHHLWSSYLYYRHYRNKPIISIALHLMLRINYVFIKYVFKLLYIRKT